MKTFTLSFHIEQSIKNKAKYLVTCDEMDYSACTTKPQEVVEGLVNEWFDLDMGQQLPLPDEH